MLLVDIAAKMEKVISPMSELREGYELSEEDTKRKLIEPFFECFGWKFNAYGEIMVKMESKLTTDSQKDKADYVFKLADASILILEAKPLGSTLSEKDRDQLKRYMRLDECKFGAISNGAIYEFYKKVDRDISLFQAMDVSKGIDVNQEQLRRLFWLYREFWEIWLELGPAKFEEIIETMSNIEIDEESITGVENVVPLKSQASKVFNEKAPRGAATSQKEFETKILEILKEKSGLSGAEIVARIGKLYEGKLNIWDLGSVPSGGTRWKNRVWFGLQSLKESGAIRLKDHLYYANNFQGTR